MNITLDELIKLEVEKLITLRNIIQIAFGIIAVVGVGGVIYEVARFCWKSYVNIDFWAVKLFYWLCVIIVGAFIACCAGIGVYFILDLLLDMGKSALKCIYQ